jgi:hypothetical protein|tara:strand:- start:2897 stop:3745 length:849 start_codon:yes stop_codon:yes gene_type:complete
MHKKLESDLISLAHSILQMKNKENIFLLKQKSREIYEKLSVLAFVEEYVNSTPGLKETKEELTTKVEKGFETKDLIHSEAAVVAEVDLITHDDEEAYLDVGNEELALEVGEDFSNEELIIEETVEKITEEIGANLAVEELVEIEQPFDDLEGLIFGETAPVDFKEDDKQALEHKGLTLEEELEDTIPVDIIADLFEPIQPVSLNDKLQANIQIGLNDRIIFVKNLFDGSQEDFNRVISQLNTFKTEKEAKKFISKMVKPDYNWSEQEELENRLLTIVERRFA